MRIVKYGCLILGLSIVIAHASTFASPTSLFTPPVVDEPRWEKSIRAFEHQDAENAPPKGEILFIGSSSIVMWKTDEDFPDLNIINRGFGGSQTSDSVQYADRIAIPYAPRLVVLYAGDNDIAAGKFPEEVFEDTKTFFALIHHALPETRILYIAIKPSISRWNRVEKMRATNSLVRAYTETDTRLQFVDVDTPMLGEDGQPRAELFLDDGLHLTREGYDLWNAIIRPYLIEDGK